MKIPAQYLTLYMLMIIGFLMICVFAAAFRKKIVLTVILVIILVGLAGVLVFGKKQVRYNRAPQGDLSILDVSIRDDGVYHDGKLEAYTTEYTLPVLNMFATEDTYVYKVIM